MHILFEWLEINSWEASTWIHKKTKQVQIEDGSSQFTHFLRELRNFKFSHEQRLVVTVQRVHGIDYSPINFIPGRESLAKSFHEGEVPLRVVERATVRDEPIKLLGNMLLVGRGLLAGRLNCYMVPYKQEVSDFNEPPVHASLSTALCSFSLHSVETCGNTRQHLSILHHTLTLLLLLWNLITLA